MTKKIGTKSMRLLISNSLYRAARMVFSIFLSIYIWKETGDIQLLALFNIFFLLFHLIGFLGCSFFVKKGYRKIIDSTALLGLILTYICMIFLGELIIDWFFVAAAITGIFNGSYYINYNVNQFDLTTFKNRGNFEGLKKAIKTTAKIIFPSIFGALITLYSIDLAFILGIVLFIIAWYIGNIDFPHNPANTQYKKFIPLVYKSKKIFLAFMGSILITISVSIILVELLIPLLVLNEVGTEIKLGFSLSFISILTIILMYLFGRFVDYKHYNKSLVLITGLYIISLLGILFSTSYSLLLVFSSVCAASMQLYAIVASVINNNVLHAIPKFQDYNVEWQGVKEVAYVIGWVTSFMIMYMSGGIGQDGLKFIFYTMIVFACLTTLFYMKVNIHELDNEK